MALLKSLPGTAVVSVIYDPAVSDGIFSITLSKYTGRSQNIVKDNIIMEILAREFGVFSFFSLF